jgi:bacterioferritin-associated ferredoxin
MIVCICNTLREKDCREAAGSPAVRRAGCVYRQLNCRVRCGACVATMKAIVDELRDEREARQARAAAETMVELEPAVLE